VSDFPKLALGTWLMGGTKDPDPSNDDARDIQVIQTAIDNDITLIDTAQNYANGRCEELVGEAVKKYPRDKYQILTKQMKEHLSYSDVINGCKASLERLGIDYLDYFVCHAPRPDVDMREFFEASNQLHKEGLIKKVGVSNFGPKNLQIAVETSNLPIAVNQVCFSMVDCDIFSTGTYDFCVKQNIPIQAYRSLVDLNENQDLKRLVSKIALSLDITIQQLVIAYLNSYENINFTIRASSAEHWQQIKDALEISLKDETIHELRSYHEKQKGERLHFLEM